jgi:hypothetical protein
MPSSHVEPRSILAQCAMPFFALFVAACGHGNDLGSPGVSDRPAEAPSRVQPAPPTPRQPWEHLAELDAYPVIDDRQLPSKGHNPPYWSGIVRVSGQLEAVYRTLGPGSVIPPGAIAVEAHRTADGGEGPRFAMVKHEPGFDARGGDWEYVVLDPAGNVEQRGILPLCARCHGDAPSDHLFGPRMSSRRKASGTEPSSATPDATPREEDEARAPPDDQLPAGAQPPPERKKRRKRP